MLKNISRLSNVLSKDQQKLILGGGEKTLAIKIYFGCADGFTGTYTMNANEEPGTVDLCAGHGEVIYTIGEEINY